MTVRQPRTKKAKKTAAEAADRQSLSPGPVWVIVFLVAVTVFAYAQVWQFGFVNYDDPPYVTKNPNVAGGLSWANVVWAFTTGHEANWHPVTWLSHMVDVQLFGLNAGAHHVTNVLFHIANTLLLFWFLYRMTGALGRSTFIAGLFGVHPLHVESAAWVAERKDVLSTLFGLLALWAYVLYVRQPRPRRYLTILALFAMSLMAKPMLVTLPFLLLLLDFWPLRRVSFEKPWNFLPLVREKIPLLILSIASGIVTVIVQQRGGAVAGLQAFPIASRVANACVAYFTYMRRMFWPTDLAVFYPSLSGTSPLWPAAALGLIALSALSLWAIRRWPYVTVGWFWYLGTLLPVIGLIQVGKQAMADRYTYIPLVGLFLIVAYAVADATASLPGRRYVLAGGGALVILACAFLTNAQAQHWRSDLALWEHTVKVTQDNSVAHYSFADALAAEGKMDDAIYHYQEALRIHDSLGFAPDSNLATAHYNLGLALANKGKADEAESHFIAAVTINPRFPEAQNSLGVNYLIQGKLDEAIKYLSEAIRLRPDYAVARNNLGSALGNRGRIEEAISEYAEAVRLDPGYAEAHSNLGILLARQGKMNEAIAHFTEALRINPDNPMARTGLANLTNGKAPPRPQ